MRVLGSLEHLLLVEGTASFCLIERGLSLVTHATLGLTAVGVIIEHLPVDVFLATWRVREAKRQSFASKEGLRVGELGPFKEDDLFIIDLSDDIVSSLGHWEEDLPVELAWLEEKA